MRRGWAFVSAMGALLVAGPVAAEDPWELAGDDSPATVNQLRHGIAQRGHDLEGPAASPDVDYFRIMTKERHSYEARVSGLYWEVSCASAPCPRLARTSATGTVLTAGAPSSDDVPRAGDSLGSTVRWIATADAEERLRTTGDLLVALHGERYDIVFQDTTLFVPRWNNSATQTTVLILQNTTNAAVTATVHFHDAAGVLLGTTPVSVPRHGTQLIATATVPGLAGLSGSAEIAQLGGYGALAGKAVALEPATGFTFDTPVLALPR